MKRHIGTTTIAVIAAMVALGQMPANAQQTSMDKDEPLAAEDIPSNAVRPPMLPELVEGRKNAPGDYLLEGVMEVGSGLQLTDDGRFRWFISYGSVDQYAAGRWEYRGPKGAEQIILIADPLPVIDKPYALAERQDWHQGTEAHYVALVNTGARTEAEKLPSPYANPGAIKPRSAIQLIIANPRLEQVQRGLGRRPAEDDALGATLIYPDGREEAASLLDGLILLKDGAAKPVRIRLKGSTASGFPEQTLELPALGSGVQFILAYSNDGDEMPFDQMRLNVTREGLAPVWPDGRTQGVYKKAD